MTVKCKRVILTPCWNGPCIPLILGISVTERTARICKYVPDKDKEKRHIAKVLKNNGYLSQHVLVN